MNNNEAKQISDQDLNWKDIISDGLYTVYKFKSSVGSWLYFMSFDSAYKQFQNQVGLIAGIFQETKIYYANTNNKTNDKNNNEKENVFQKRVNDLLNDLEFEFVGEKKQDIHIVGKISNLDITIKRTRRCCWR